MVRALFHKLQWLFGPSATREPPRACDSTLETAAHVSWRERAHAAWKAGQLEQALECFSRAGDLVHDDVDVLLGQAEIYVELGRDEDARDFFELTLAFAPNNCQALLGMARLARKSSAADSLHYLQRALKATPNEPVLHFECGLSHTSNGDIRAARDAYRRALELDPNYAAAIVNLGMLHLSRLGDAIPAQQLFERAVALQPESVAAQANLGLALQQQGRFPEAFAHYERLISSEPEVTEYRWNRGLAHLSVGDFARGWPDYELRDVRAGRSPRRFPFRRWNGESPLDGELLVHGEQGLGDEIMFASCIPDLLRRVPRVVIECNTRLESLFARSFPSAKVHGAPRDGNRDWLAGYPELVAQIPIGSLPLLWRHSYSDFPQHSGYLSVDSARVARWRSQLAALGSGTKIGICWRAGTPGTKQELRSLTLQQCLPLLNMPDCVFICLNYGDCAEEVAAARRAAVKMHWWPDAVQDLEEMAALVTAVDHVITVPSSVVHLTGAVGQPVAVMVPASPEWRYLWAGDRMPWYPSAHLFRQSRAGNWQPVIEAVAAHVRRTVELGDDPAGDR